jgi:hypothetical protein
MRGNDLFKKIAVLEKSGTAVFIFSELFFWPYFSPKMNKKGLAKVLISEYNE